MPELNETTTLADFQSNFWTAEQLQSYARSVGLTTTGGKRNLYGRIMRYMLDHKPQMANKHPVNVPDSSMVTIDDSTPVVLLKLDANTRQFFKSRIGASFKFNQYLRNIASLENPRSLNLTYGNLVQGWYDYEEQRKREKIIKPQYQYQQFVRDFYNHEENKSKPITVCSSQWQCLKKNGCIRNRLA